MKSTQPLTWSLNSPDTRPCPPPYPFSHLNFFLKCPTLYYQLDQGGMGEALHLACLGPQIFGAHITERAGTAGTHTPLKLQFLCVCVCYSPAKWCHPLGTVFIIETPKADFVAKVIYHHLKEALVCVRPVDSLFFILRKLGKLKDWVFYWKLLSRTYNMLRLTWDNWICPVQRWAPNSDSASVSDLFASHSVYLYFFTPVPTIWFLCVP